jgi:hypothetical protein
MNKIKTFKKHFLAFIIICSLVSKVQANNLSTDYKSLDKPFDEWVLLKEVSGITVYYKIIKCESQDLINNPTSIDPSSIDNHETFALKFVNDNSTSKSISFSKITKTNGSDEMEAISLSPGTTIIESCETTAKLMLTQNTDDGYPISFNDYLNEFKLTTNN